MGKATLFSGGISARSASLRKNVSVATIYRWIRNGKITAQKRGGRYYIKEDNKFRQAKNTSVAIKIAKLRYCVKIALSSKNYAEQ